MHLWHPASEINRSLRNNYSIRLQKNKSHVNNPPSTRDDTDLRGKKKLRSPAKAAGQLLFQLQSHSEAFGL